jgi:NAD(P)-dependent dehydrogenase (short-subunit alcohol dehydrogenase family)
VAERKLLENKVAIVTGAGSGIGESIAARYIEEGAKLLAIDLKAPAIDAHGGQVATLALDVTDADAPARILDAVKSAFGRLDILVNNAGICLPGSIEDQTPETWERTLAVNVTAPFRITQALVPLLKESKAGRIINLGSIMSDFGGPNLCAYGMSKHAMAGFTKSLACDLGQYGITANYLQPGSIWSAMSRPHMANPDFLKYWETKTPLGRIGDPEDVAAPAVFLATDEAKFITGAGIRVCGGAMASF